MIKLVECPRDAWQGMVDFIPTTQKAAYINHLVKVGFDTIDFGSFVNPKAMPQMKDTAELMSIIDTNGTATSLLAIVANLRGAEDAVNYSSVKYLGFPLSVSETFQQRNTNKSIQEALETVRKIQDLCAQKNRILVIYLSMGFGNPYGDPFDADVVLNFTQQMAELDIKVVSLADTIGVATNEMITKLYAHLIPEYPTIEFGAHLHSNPTTASEKIIAAYKAGCRRFDGAIKGFGGCPMADDELVGNIPTELLLKVLPKEELSVDPIKFSEAMNKSLEIFH